MKVNFDYINILFSAHEFSWFQLCQALPYCCTISLLFWVHLMEEDCLMIISRNLAAGMTFTQTG